MPTPSMKGGIFRPEEILSFGNEGTIKGIGYDIIIG